MFFGTWDPFRDIQSLLRPVHRLLDGLGENLQKHPASHGYINTGRIYKFEIAPWSQRRLTPRLAAVNIGEGRSQSLPRSALPADIHHQADPG